MPDVKTITLDSLAQGAAGELFQNALARVLENIEDPNTDHRTKRALTIQFLFSADEERRLGNVEIRAATKLAGIKGVTRPLFFGRHEGALVAVETPSQRDLFGDPHGKPKLVDKETGEVKEATA